MSAGGLLFFLCLNDRGGAELSMLKLACGLAGQGRRVTLAVYGAMPQLAREAGFRGEVIDLKARRTLAAIVPLARLLRGRDFTAVLSALTLTNVAAALARLLAWSETPLIVTEHGLDDLVRCEDNPPYSLFVAAAYSCASAVVAVSERLANRWRQELRREVLTIYNPVVDEALDPGSPPHRWLIDKDTPVIMAAGRLKPEKDFATLLRAFALVAAERDVRLVLLGEGPQRPALETLAGQLGLKDRVAMPGFQKNMVAWLAGADLFVCSSLREGFGNVLVEAMAQGVPVVSTDCPFGPREILQGGDLGSLTPPGDAESLSRAMLAALVKPVDTVLLRARAQDFSSARCIAAYLALVDRVCRAGRK